MVTRDQLTEPWSLEARDSALNRFVVAGSRRSATAADVNGNGFKEAIVVYVDGSGGQDMLHLLVTDGVAPAATTTDLVIPIDARYLPVFDLRVAAGDFDNDMTDEVV